MVWGFFTSKSDLAQALDMEETNTNGERVDQQEDTTQQQEDYCPTTKTYYIKKLLQQDCKDRIKESLQYFYPALTDFSVDKISFGGITEVEIQCSFGFVNESTSTTDSSRVNVVLFCWIRPEFDEQPIETITSCMIFKGMCLQNQYFAILSSLSSDLTFSLEECRTMCSTRDILFIDL